MRELPENEKEVYAWPEESFVDRRNFWDDNAQLTGDAHSDSPAI